MRIALFYFVFVSTTGLLLPYFPKYLDALGFSGTQIARVLSIGPLLLMCVPPVWGFAADKTGRTALLLKLACACAACVLVVNWMAGISSYAGVLAVWFVYYIFQTPLLPLSDSLAIVEARRIGTDYARLRLWGSISFILVAFGFGQYLKGGGDIKAVPLVAAYLGCGSALCVHLLKHQAGSPRRLPPSLKDARRLLRDRGLMWFFAAGMMHQAALSPYYLFYGIFMDERGLGQGIVSWSFGLGVGAEVTMFWFARPLLARWPLFPMLAIAFLISAARWAVVAHLHDGTAMALLQMLHAFTFAFWYAGSVAHLEKQVAEPLRVTGRALFSALPLGLGGVLGHSIAGWIRDAYGIAKAFECAAVLDVAALVPLLLAAHFTRTTFTGPLTAADRAAELSPPVME